MQVVCYNHIVLLSCIIAVIVTAYHYDGIVAGEHVGRIVQSYIELLSCIIAVIVTAYHYDGNVAGEHVGRIVQSYIELLRCIITIIVTTLLLRWYCYNRCRLYTQPIYSALTLYS